MDSPYSDLPDRAFWRTGVSEQPVFKQDDFYRPKFPISKTTAIVTAGSCFAQHVGRVLRNSGYNIVDTEPVPRKIPGDVTRKYGYHLYSARYGNIYTIRQFLQLAREAQGQFTPENIIWEKDGRYFDALRPNIEPFGLEAPEMVLKAREYHLAAVAEALTKAELIVFTFGLTETWEHRQSGTIYPTAPGTIAGHFDPEIYQFRNFRYDEVLADFLSLRALLRALNPNIRFLLTVSPVPLTATASGDHVLVATMQSKSTLRAVCGTLVADLEDVDYFPSYEIVAAHPTRARMFASNMRSVTDWGVKTVMQVFLNAHGSGKKAANVEAKKAAAKTPNTPDDTEIICEEELLEAFRS